MKILLYPHGGSGNHGCEAIVRTTSKILSDSIKPSEISLASYEKDQDSKYGVDFITEFIDFCSEQKYSIVNIIGKIHNDCFKRASIRDKRRVKNILKKIDKDTLCVSIGGDMYSYNGVIPYSVLAINKAAKRNGKQLILWGCSIGEDCINKYILDDLKGYDLIIARESITYKNLISINPNTKLHPDPAFTLDTVKLELPDGFIENNVIGINVSPLIVDCEQNKGATMENYIALVQHIIDTTDMQIALIPHVVWKNNDDRKPLRELYEKFQDTGRVIMIEDHNCMELKGYISRCRMFIGARTHATIAAYSSCVPTLVVGYSVKAKGIAKDIFGTNENYVVPVQTLKNKDDLINAFEWMKEHESEIRTHLQNFMPSYIKSAREAGDEVKNLMNESSGLAR